MVIRNTHIGKLQAGYLFPEIEKRKQDYLAQHPEAALISLGIGDTTQPLISPIVAEVAKFAQASNTHAGYLGYGPAEGMLELRQRIAAKLYNNTITADEIFISDGAKPDCGRLQLLFSPTATVAIQDPAYPVYVDTSVMLGRTGNFDSHTKGYSQIVYMPCNPQNDFFPDLSKQPRTDLIFFCSPNNPTGATATREQLKQLVAFAQTHGSIIIYDSAYAEYIQDPALPRSIFEIPGARSCAIEVNSLSKSAGFTGVRLGWTIIPKELRFSDGTPVYNDWKRIVTTFFNGASRFAQVAALAALADDSYTLLLTDIAHYMQNAQILKQALAQNGIAVYGGDHSPFLWAHFPGQDSWQLFNHFLHNLALITTPGSGFGPAGQGFLRLSALNKRPLIEQAAERITVGLSLT